MMSKYWLMFSLFFKIGAFSFGGGLAMLPAIYQSVASYNLVNMAEFTNLVAISQATPGAMVINAATYIGMEYAGFMGALLATLGASIPSAGIVLLVFSLSGKIKKSSWIDCRRSRFCIERSQSGNSTDSDIFYYDAVID